MENLFVEIGQRIKKVRLALGLPQEAFGKLLNVGKSFVSALEKGKSKVNVEHLVKLLMEHGVNINYILSGKGEMFNPPQYKDVKHEILEEVNRMLKEHGLS